MAIQKTLWIGVLLLAILVYFCQATDLEASCTPPAKNVADECSIDNSECKTDTCVCKTGFIKENGKCPKALKTVCVNVDECVSNSKCEGAVGSKKCSCKNGYTEKNGLCSKDIGSDCQQDGDCPASSNTKCENTHCVCKDDYAEKNEVCTPIKVSETTCTKDAASQCQHTPNAKCDNNAQGAKCKCSEGYAENRSDGTTCVKTCTANGNECGSIANSHCDTDRCACNDGFIMNANVCNADSGASMLKFGAVLSALSLLTAYLLKF